MKELLEVDVGIFLQKRACSQDKTREKKNHLDKNREIDEKKNDKIYLFLITI